MPEGDLFLRLLRPLNRAGIRYIVGGSVAAMSYGDPRFTNDVEVVVFLRATDIQRLSEVFPTTEFYLPSLDAIALCQRTHERTVAVA